MSTPTVVHLPFPAIQLNGATLGDAYDIARACVQRIDALDVSQGHKSGLYGIVDSFQVTVQRLAARSGEAPDNVKVNAFVNGFTNGTGTITLSEFRVSVLPAVAAFVDDSTIGEPEPTVEAVEAEPVARKKR